MESSPKDLEPFTEAYKFKRNMKDEEMWLMGAYVMSAVTVAVERNLAGRKAKSRYIEKPLSQGTKESVINDNMTEDEKREVTQQLFYRLQILQSNYELNNKGKG